jgi:putative DNA primase/helicase
MVADDFHFATQSPLQPRHIPAELKAIDQWVGWNYATRNGQATKLPFNPRTGGCASSTDPETWASCAAALAMVEAGAAAGVGFVPLPANGLTFVDLDDAVDAAGVLAPWAHTIVEALDTYTEFSPSHRGLRLVARGQKPDTRRSKRGDVEIYDGRMKDGAPGGRVLSITGLLVPDHRRTIESRPEAITAIYRRELEPTPAADGPAAAITPTGLSDAEVITRALHCRAGERFRRLWRGEWELAGYPSQSEADLSLCGLLAFFSGDPAQVERVFGLSALGRQDKWRARSDYRTNTVAVALAGCRAFYRRGGRP